MGSQQKLQLEDEMKSEQEKRLNERKEKLEQELDIERKQLANLEQQQKNEKPPKDSKLESPSGIDKATNSEKERQDEVSRLTDGIAHKEFIVSKILQQAALCTISVRYGIKSIIVSWSLGEDMKAMVGDWIGFYKVGQPAQNYKRVIKTGGSRQGHETIPAPKTPGLYHFKYFLDSSYNEVCVSDVIHIGPQIVLKANLIEDPVDIKKNEIEVIYSLKGGELNSNDWFGLYNASESNNKNYITYYRVGDASKSNSFRIAAPRLPGDYTIRFFPNLCGYNFVSKSNTLRIINHDKLNIEYEFSSDSNARVKSLKVTWNVLSMEVTAYDYIALYKQDSVNNYYETFQYVDVNSGFLKFEAPKEVGVYNLRYHSAQHSKYIDITRSEIISIQNTDAIYVTSKNGIVTVTWDIFSQPPTTWDWIGIFEEGAPNTSYLMFSYINLNSNNTSFQPVPTGKRCEARYFSSKVGKYVDFRKSSIFTT
jgi:hypothetical protein